MASLRARKSELEDIISHKTNYRPQIDPQSIVKQFKWAIDNWDDTHMKEIIKMLVQKIYADNDGAVTVLIGVHINGAADQT